MYHISQKAKSQTRAHFVLLEHIPSILISRILLLLFLYFMAFTLLLLGLKMLHLEDQLHTVNATAIALEKKESLSQSLLYQTESNQEIQKNIASQIIRLHVIANSDTAQDQALKLKVRDAVLSQLQQNLQSATSMENARSIILTQIAEIEKKAKQEIENQGYDYNIRISLERRYFPVKVYGDLSFPAGYYEALCLEIGAAAGHNWWCVLFPSLCFVDETYAIVPKDSKIKLKKSLSRQEYKALKKVQKPVKSKAHSAIYDWLKRAK